jgi:hypothetical protein
MFLLPEGQTGEALKPYKRKWCFGNLEALDKKVRLVFIVFKGLDI